MTRAGDLFGDVDGGAHAAGASISAELADRRARELACRSFDEPLVLIAGAGTGKTTTLVARVVAWLCGPGWARARADVAARAHELGRRVTDRDARIAARAVEGVLAITFTKTAAADMDQKVRAALRTLERGERPLGLPPGVPALEHVPDVDADDVDTDNIHAADVQGDDARELDVAERARALRLALDRPLATTIHAFCQDVLAAHPLEAGLPPRFEVDADQERSAERVRATVERMLTRALRTEAVDRPWTEAWTRLAHAGVGPADVERALLELLQKGADAAAFEHDPLTPRAVELELADLALALDQLFASGAARLANARGAIAADTLDALRSLRANLPAVLADDAHVDHVCAEVIGAFPKKALERVRDWSKAKFTKGEAAEAGEDEPRIVASARVLATRLTALVQLDPQLLRAARTLVASALAELETERVREGSLTFPDLLTLASKLLWEHAHVRRSLRARLRQVLVDEFQDTDPEQCRLVEALCFADRGVERPGLFLVGDPKQSIYGWRGADLRAWQTFVDDLVARGGSVHDLVVNYRSTRTVLAQVERFLRPVMREEKGIQFPFQPLVSHRAVDGPLVELWVPWELDQAGERRLERTTSGRALEIEARMVAEALRDEHARGTPWSHAALLMRSKTSLDTYLEALRELGIPYEVQGDRSYYRRREIQDACAALMAIADPSDALALLAFLRSSVAGVPDAAWIPLWSADLPTFAAELVGPFSPEQAATLERLLARAAQHGECAGFEPAARHALEALALLRASLRVDPPDVFVERVRTLLGLELGESARHLGSFRRANLARFFARVTQALDASGGDALALLRALRRALGERRAATEVPSSEPPRDAVRVMTVHGAKGLDFHHVYVVGLHRRDRPVGAPSIGFAPIVQGRDARATAQYRLFGSPTPGWWRVEEELRVREAAERVRLLYVALTRARDRLVLGGTWEGRPVRTLDAARSFVDLLAHGAPELLVARLQETCGGAERDYARDFERDFELDGLRVRLPNVRSEPRVHATERALPSREEALQELARFEHARAAACERAARPRIARASGATESAFERADSADERWSDESTRAPLDDDAHAGTPAHRSTSHAAVTRSRARAVGTALHAVLEHADFADPSFATNPAIDERLARVLRELDAEPATLDFARTAWDAFARAALPARLTALAPRIVARELALSVAADALAAHATTRNDSSDAGSAATRALDVVHGSADLVYQDEDGRFVVADFKTEAPADAAAHDVAARRHAPQLAAYACALELSLALERAPRRELWFVRTGRVVELA